MKQSFGLKAFRKANCPIYCKDYFDDRFPNLEKLKPIGELTNLRKICEKNKEL